MKKNILVTGTSTGIGRSIALDLSARGWRVYAGVRKSTDAESLREDADGEIVPLIIDVAKQDSVERAIAELAEQTGGQLHALVNNAGVYLGGPLELMSAEEIERS